MTNWLAIDPAFSASNHLGWAVGGNNVLLEHNVIDFQQVIPAGLDLLTIIGYGAIKLNKPKRGPRKKSRAADRIAGIEHMLSSLQHIVDNYNVNQMLVEWPGGTQSATAATALSICSAMLFSLATLRKLDFFFITPQGMKKALTGNRNAEKAEIATAVHDYYGERKWARTKNEREAIVDALGIALAIHYHQMGTQFIFGEPYE